MLTRFPIQNCRAAATAIVVAATSMIGCAVNLPPAPASNPADPGAPAAASAPLRPTLLASSYSFLSPAAATGATKVTSQPGALSAAAAIVYTCPMHSEVQETTPGNCSICGMTLVKNNPTSEGAKP